jgi:hypothetical protein
MRRAICIAACAVAAALLLAAPAALGRSSANPAIQVHFSLTGTITVTLPDGTPVGSTSGQPTVIPAGYYTVLLLGPGGCATIPYFELKGPGESIVNNLTEGEVDNDSVNAFFQPNATYTWRNQATPGVTYTFQTSSQVLGSPPAQVGPGGLSASNHTTVSSSDLVGSGVLPFRGKLTGAISSAGRLSLAFGGKSVTGLKAGRYTLVVTDKSASAGLQLRKGKYSPQRLTTGKFVGKRSVSIRLTAGHWVFSPSPGKQAFTIPVT